MIDDRYTSGVWYDAQASEFCRIAVEDDRVVLRTLDGELFHEYDSGEEFNRDSADFYEVPESALRDPAAFFEDVVEYLFDRAELPVDQDTGFRYAREVVSLDS